MQSAKGGSESVTTAWAAWAGVQHGPRASGRGDRCSLQGWPVAVGKVLERAGRLVRAGQELLVHEGLTRCTYCTCCKALLRERVLICVGPRFNQCEHVIDKLMQRGEQMERESRA